MTMIESRTNRRLKDIRRLRKCKGDRAVLEGPHLIREALESGVELESVLVSPEFRQSAEGAALVARLPEPLEVAPALLRELADADAPQGVLAVASLPRGGVSVLPIAARGLYVFVDRLQEPGNLGALVRVAEATGVAGIALSPGCVHPNHPRALRASAGSLLRVAVARGVEAGDLRNRLQPLAPPWAALVPRGGSSLFEVELELPLVVALGGEGSGLSPEVARGTDLELTIPVEGRVESLNSTVAAALALYEVRRRSSLPLA